MTKPTKQHVVITCTGLIVIGFIVSGLIGAAGKVGVERAKATQKLIDAAPRMSPEQLEKLTRHIDQKSELALREHLVDHFDAVTHDHGLPTEIKVNGTRMEWSTEDDSTFIFEWDGERWQPKGEVD